MFGWESRWENKDEPWDHCAFGQKKIYCVGKTSLVKFSQYLFWMSVFLSLIFLHVNVAKFLLRTQKLKIIIKREKDTNMTQKAIRKKTTLLGNQYKMKIYKRFTCGYYQDFLLKSRYTLHDQKNEFVVHWLIKQLPRSYSCGKKASWLFCVQPLEGCIRHRYRTSQPRAHTS